MNYHSNELKQTLTILTVHFSPSFPILFSKKRNDWGRDSSIYHSCLSNNANQRVRFDYTRAIYVETSFRDRGRRGLPAVLPPFPLRSLETGVSDFRTLSSEHQRTGASIISTAAQLLETRRAIKLWGSICPELRPPPLSFPSRGRGTREEGRVDWWRSTDFAREITLPPLPPPLI